MTMVFLVIDNDLCVEYAATTTDRNSFCIFVGTRRHKTWLASAIGHEFISISNAFAWRARLN